MRSRTTPRAHRTSSARALAALALLGAVSACSSAGLGIDGGLPFAPPGGEPADLATSGDLVATPADAAGRTPLGAPGDVTRTLAAHPARLYDVHIPSGYDGVTPLPVLLNLHGGGGNREVARKTACPDGDPSSPGCLEALADARGFVIVTPDGTGMPAFPNRRTFNAGGGSDGWQCISGYACDQSIDEAAYFAALLADLKLVLHYRADRVYATGFSNGAALAHRLACERPDLIAGIAPVSGGNQYATTKACSAAKPVLEIHGSADPCWLYAGGTQSCADSNPGSKVSIPITIEGWLARNGCTTAPVDTSLPDSVADDTTTIRHTYGCASGHAVVLYEVIGGGHNWPSGGASLANGPTARDFSASQVILDFFAALP